MSRLRRVRLSALLSAFRSLKVSSSTAEGSWARLWPMATIVRVVRLVADGQHVPDCPSLRPPVTTIEGDTATVTGYVCWGCLLRPLEEVLAEVRGDDQP